MAFLLPVLLLALWLHLQSPASAPPALIPMTAIAVQAQAYQAASVNRPLLIRSVQEASAYFSDPDLARLSREVDFSRQQVLLFAWRGSGQDKLEAVLEASAATFIYSPGRTRDLREHHAVFVLRSDLSWNLR